MAHHQNVGVRQGRLSADPQAQRLTVAVTHNFVRPLWTLCGTLLPFAALPHSTPDRA